MAEGEQTSASSIFTIVFFSVSLSFLSFFFFLFLLSRIPHFDIFFCLTLLSVCVCRVYLGDAAGGVLLGLEGNEAVPARAHNTVSNTVARGQGKLSGSARDWRPLVARAAMTAWNAGGAWHGHGVQHVREQAERKSMPPPPPGSRRHQGRQLSRHQRPKKNFHQHRQFSARNVVLVVPAEEEKKKRKEKKRGKELLSALSLSSFFLSCFLVLHFLYYVFVLR